MALAGENSISNSSFWSTNYLLAVDFLDRYKKAIAVPPSLPSVHPTISAWQEPPHPTIATAQSSTLPNEVDIAIIGSGITGASVAYTLLNGTSPETSSLRISVLEARNAVSGATGRNGGHLVSDSHILFAGVVESLGEEEARRVLHFSEANIARLKALVSELDPVDREAVELRDVVMTSAILDEELVEFVKQSVEMVERLVPDRTMHCRMISKEEGESVSSTTLLILVLGLTWHIEVPLLRNTRMP